jgi:hypothetical protein
VADKNPVTEAFLQHVTQHPVWGEVFVETANGVFRLRHVADRDLAQAQLQLVPTEGLRKLASFNAAGEFRPLRAAPDLAKGWLWTGRSAVELVRAVQELYPASVVDWFAVERSSATPTGYRDFTNRQSGMYRITQHLRDEQAAQVIRACCAPGLCLKQRLWSVERLPTDAAASKSFIPCLEPCAILLELARKAARIEQEDKITIQISPSDLKTLLAGARSVLEGPGSTARAGNIASDANPRRIQLVLEKYGKAVDGEESREED